MADSYDDDSSGAASFLSPSDSSSSNINEEIMALKRALMNEKAAPELLPFETELIRSLTDKMKEQQTILDESKFDHTDILYAAMYQMDLDRIRYLLASYFRTRLTKIKASIFYLESEMGTIRPLLSAEERAFVQKYSKLKLDHFNHAVLDVAAISDHFRPLNDPAIATPPDLQQWVFCRVLMDVGDFIPRTEALSEPLHLTKGDSLIVKYAIIRDLVLDKSVCLS